MLLPSETNPYIFQSEKENDEGSEERTPMFEALSKNSLVTADPHEVIKKNVDTVAFMKAQATFIARQTFFLEEGRSAVDNEVYIKHVTAYSRAQGEYIKALLEVISQLGWS